MESFLISNCQIYVLVVVSLRNYVIVMITPDEVIRKSYNSSCNESEAEEVHHCQLNMRWVSYYGNLSGYIY